MEGSHELFLKACDSGSEYDIAQICLNISENCYVNICEKLPSFYVFKNHKWKQEGALQSLYKFLNEDVSNMFLELNMNDAKKIAYKLKGSFKHKVIDEFAKLVYNCNFYSKLDAKKHLIGFENGVYDLILNEFREGIPEDFISKSVRYDYQPIMKEDEIIVLQEFYSQIYPYADLKIYMMQQYAQMLYGGIQNSIVHFHSGSGGNGKSLIALLMQETFGEYALKLESTTLCNSKFIDPNSPDPQKLALKGVRFCYISEPPSGSVLNSSVLKDLSGGEYVTARALYSNNRVTFEPQFKINIFVNDGQGFTFDGADGGLERRLKMIQYVSKFVNETPDFENFKFLKDEFLLQKLRQMKQTHMNLLLKMYKHGMIYTCPTRITKWTQNELYKNNDIKKFIDDNFNFTNEENDYIKLKDIKQLYQLQSKEFNIKKIKQLKENLIEILGPCLNQKWINGEKVNSVFVKWQFKC
tara:strand:+ start:164 stop:1567 length:1404 start_codon:yes stop_codon:yes gene_type:complete